MKKLICSLLTLTVLGVVSLPVQADEGDGVLVQDARQSVYQTGDDNYAGQTSIQQNREYRQGRRSGNTGDVMTSDQLVDQYGIGNRSQQRIRQENTRSNSCRRQCNDN